MNARFDEAKYRPFNHAISCLSRFGDKVSVLCLPVGEKDHVLRLSAINATGSAFCAFFFSLTFFEAYSANKRHDLQLQVRNVQSILKSQVNRHLEHIELELLGSVDGFDDDDEVDEDDYESRFAFRLHGKNGVVRTHKLTYESKSGLFPRDDATEYNAIEVNVKTISELLDHFASKSNGDITMQCTKDACLLTSMTEDYTDKNQRRSVATRVEVKSEAFYTYKIIDEGKITFGLREFKAGIALADHLHAMLKLRFSAGGRPLSLLVECKAGFLAHIFIATSAPEPTEAELQRPDAQDATADEAPRANGHQHESASQNASTSIADQQQARQASEEDLESGSQAAVNARARGDAIASTQPGADAVQSGRDGAATRAGGPVASTPLRAAPARDTPEDASMRNAASQSFTQMEGSLFRGMGDFDDGESQHASQSDSTRSRIAVPALGTSSAPATSSASQRAAPTQPLPSALMDELPSEWPEDSSLTFDEETRLAGLNEEINKDKDEAMPDDSSSLGATDDEEELPGSQEEDASGAKRRRYEPLF